MAAAHVGSAGGGGDGGTKRKRDPDEVDPGPSDAIAGILVCDGLAMCCARV